MKSLSTERIGRNPTYRRVLIVSIRLVTLIAASAYPDVHANDEAAAGQWNIMVVPAREAIYSGQAREIFNKQCASCHSKDGRAQTRVAQQRHVRDLSESRLTDDVIIEQILEGTHNKENTFKMSPFKDKLSRVEIESLVPLVKAFRPASREQQKDVSSTPRLAGLINCPYGDFAVLETAGDNPHYFLLREKESHEGVTLLKLMPKKGMVKLRVGETNPTATLVLDGWAASHTRGAGLSGFLARLSIALNSAPPRIVLSKANTELVLFLYSQFSGRTLIRSPRLPDSTFDLDIWASGPNDTARRLKKALAAKGITTIEDGEKFLLVVPTSEVSTIKPGSSGIKSLTSDNDRQGRFPGGVFVNLSNADLSQVVQLYSELTGRKLEQLPPQNRKVTFTTQTALSTTECAYALETLLIWNGVKVVPEGGSASKLDPPSGSSQ